MFKLALLFFTLLLGCNTISFASWPDKEQDKNSKSKSSSQNHSAASEQNLGRWFKIKYSEPIVKSCSKGCVEECNKNNLEHNEENFSYGGRFVDCMYDCTRIPLDTKPGFNGLQPKKLNKSDKK